MSVRAYSNAQRIATGRITKDGRFFQAYPFKKFYISEVSWQDELKKSYSLEFVHEDVKRPMSTVTPKSADKPIEKSYKYYKNTIKTLPAGRYYIGDLCYSLKKDIYDGVFGDNAYRDGYYETKDGCFLVAGTAHGGDGYYESICEGKKGYKYGVYAGIIGIASMGVSIPEDNMYGGTVHTFEEPVDCKFKNGFFEFSSGDWYLEIDTYGDDFDDVANY